MKTTAAGAGTALRTKIVIAVPCAIVLAAAVTACGTAASGAAAPPSTFSPSPGAQAGTVTSPADSQLRAYVRAHPVPARPGMTAGIQSFSQPGGSVGYKYFRCPPSGFTRGSAVSVGDYDDCLAWTAVIVTRAGTLTVTCGSMTSDTPCPSRTYPANGIRQSPFPDDGDYLYVPSDGQVTAARDVRVIRREAIS